MELTWKAIYLDGKTLNQYNEDRSVNKYTDIDRSKIHSFELYKNYERWKYYWTSNWELSRTSFIEKKLIFRLILEKGQRLIFRRRVAMNMQSTIKEVIYLVGWQKNIKGENVQSISYVFEDGPAET